MSTLINFLDITIYSLLIFPAVTVIANLLAGYSKKRKENAIKENHDFGVIITAYKNYSITVTSIESFVKQKYPSSKYQIYVVADDCPDANPAENSPNSVKLLIPDLPLSSKVKSIKYAMNNFIRKHDYVIVMDADNVVSLDYLSSMNRYTQEYSAVQGKRTHKNLDTIYSCLDAAGEIYYNYTQRSVPFNLGSSAAISGSGMAVRSELFEKFISKINDEDKVIIAEDKMLQNYLVGENIQIAFAEEAVIYDEKISKGYQAQRQRTRWLNSYFENIQPAFGIICAGIKNRNFNQFFFGVMTAYPPIITMILASLTVLLLSLIIGSNGWMFIVLGWALFSANLFLVLIIKKAKIEIWKSLFSIPLFAFRQLLALFNLKKNKNDFLATEHTQIISLNEIYEGK